MTKIALLLMLLVLIGCSEQQRSYAIRDECGPIGSTVYHSVTDADICRVRCRGTCDSQDAEYLSSSFVDNGLRCHDCNCTCRI